MDGAVSTPSRFFGVFHAFSPVFHVSFRKLCFFLKKDTLFSTFGFEISANRM